MSDEDRDMGCCGSCGGEAPNHTNDAEVKNQQPQEQDKEKK